MDEQRSNADEPAFPCQSSLHGKMYEGITKEEYFAAQAPPVPGWYQKLFKMKISEEELFWDWRFYYGGKMAKLYGE